MAGRPWMTKEVKLLKFYYAQKPAAWIGEVLNRSTTAIEQRARFEGLCYRDTKSNLLTPNKLKSYINKGFSKRRIAKESGVNITTVRKYIKQLSNEYQNEARNNGQTGNATLPSLRLRQAN